MRTRTRRTTTTLLLLGPLLVLAGLAACGLGSVEPLPLRITLQANRTTATAGDTIEFVVNVQGATLIGVTIEFGDGESGVYPTGGARTARVRFRYTYSTAGTYQVVATVIDAQAGQREATLEVVIEPPASVDAALPRVDARPRLTPRGPPVSWDTAGVRVTYLAGRRGPEVTARPRRAVLSW